MRLKWVFLFCIILILLLKLFEKKFICCVFFYIVIVTLKFAFLYKEISERHEGHIWWNEWNSSGTKKTLLIFLLKQKSKWAPRKSTTNFSYIYNYFSLILLNNFSKFFFLSLYTKKLKSITKLKIVKKNYEKNSL